MFKKFLAKKASNHVVKLLEKLYPEADFEMENKKILEMKITATSTDKLTIDKLQEIEETTGYTFEKEIKNEEENYQYIFMNRTIKEDI